MPELKFPQILKQLKQKEFQPLYLFHGEESFFIDVLTQEIEKNALPDEQKSFNQIVLYGKDIRDDLGKIIDTAMRLPMMAEKQVVIIKEAQLIKEWDKLLPYIEKPTPSTLLVFAHKNKKIDGRSSFAKQIKKNGVFFESKAYKDYQIPKFIEEYVTSKQFTISPKSSQLLVEFLGTDLSKIVNELEKLFIVLKDKNITPDAIEENIGISKDYNVFELQNAFLKKDTKKIFQILGYFKQNPKAGNIIFVITMLYASFAKLYTLKQLKGVDDSALSRAIGVPPYFLKDYKQALTRYSESEIKENIILLNEYDLKGKGIGNVSLSGDELLKELALKVLSGYAKIQ